MGFFTLFISIFLYTYISLAAVDAKERIWAAVILTLHGDSTPHVLPQPRALTPFGARQLVGAGSAIRDRYLSLNESETVPATRIQGISPQLNNNEVDILALAEECVAASAQAFMQGLYPPLQGLPDTKYAIDKSAFVNGILVNFPLNGYQYPFISTADSQDPNLVPVAGHINCPTYSNALLAYRSSDEFQQLLSESIPFYADMYSRILHVAFTPETATIVNAYDIFEYLNYEYLHNSTAQSIISTEDLDHARYLADQYIYATNSNMNLSGFDPRIHAIAGKTMAYNIVRALESNVHSRGSTNKLTLLFGGFEPMVALAALSGLALDRQDGFYGMPNQGASMIFELFSFETNPSASYPSSDTSLNIRFFLRNNTNVSDTATPFSAFPLFGHGPGQMAIEYKEFINRMVDLMMPVSEWCQVCGSPSLFCSAYTGAGDSNLPYDSGDPTNPTDGKALHPAVAGVIGAVVTVIVIGLIEIVVILAVGFRLRRKTTSQKPDLGGFKGGSKLASDPDLAVERSDGEQSGIPIARNENSLISPRAPDISLQRHERTGSWELGDRSSHGRSQSQSSDNVDESFLYPGDEPVRAYECV